MFDTHVPNKTSGSEHTQEKRETLFELNSSNIIVGDIVMNGVGWKRGKREVGKESRRGKESL
jgi:hypothetical protein